MSLGVNFSKFRSQLEGVLNKANLLSAEQKEIILNQAQTIFDAANASKQTDGSEEVLDDNELDNAARILKQMISNMLSPSINIKRTPDTGRDDNIQVDKNNSVEMAPIEISYFTEIDSSVKEYLEKDLSYQAYKQEFIDIKTKMKKIENKYGMSITGSYSDLREEFKINKTADQKDYADYKLCIKQFTMQLESYEKIMSEWKDGKAFEVYRRGANVFHNLERITLTNGQRAWKSDEGVFFPYRDGLIGGDPVPKDLIP